MALLRDFLAGHRSGACSTSAGRAGPRVPPAGELYVLRRRTPPSTSTYVGAKLEVVVKVHRDADLQSTRREPDDQRLPRPVDPLVGRPAARLTAAARLVGRAVARFPAAARLVGRAGARVPAAARLVGRAGARFPAAARLAGRAALDGVAWAAPWARALGDALGAIAGDEAHTRRERHGEPVDR